MSHAGSACPKRMAGRTAAIPELTPRPVYPGWSSRGCRLPECPAIRSPCRRHRAGNATSRHLTQRSLRNLSRTAPEEAREPLGDTHTLLCRSGPPPSFHRGAEHPLGGRLQRRRNKRSRTQYRCSGALTHRPGRDATLTQRTQHGRHCTLGRTTRRIEGTQIRGNARRLSNARNTRHGERVNLRMQEDHAAVNCGHSRKRLTRDRNATRTLQRHPSPTNVLIAFPQINSRPKATPRRKRGEYKKITLDCVFCG
jgi:hypothetical protein